MAAAPPPSPLTGLAAAISATDDAAAAVVPARPAAIAASAGRAVAYGTGGRRQPSTPASAGRPSPQKGFLQWRCCSGVSVACALQACLAAAWTTGAAVAAALALGSEAALGPRPAHALGFSGLKDLLTEQKKRTADFLYRPIERSRAKLDQVLRLVGVEVAGDDALREAIDLTTAAARDCILPNAGSLAGFQLSTGIEASAHSLCLLVCTFKLILKNAASLLDNADARKLDGEAALADLVRNFTALKGELLDSVSKRTGERSGLTAAVKDTVAALDNFQASIKEVLGTA
eukprot:SM000227S07448  [mRNA]  locus=s227:154871:157281:+ [translate_table: standard]